VLVLENADISPSRLWNKIIKGKSDFLFAAEAQQIEHEHDAAVATLWRALARGWPRRRPCEVGTSTSTIPLNFGIPR
jgi:hypothetical protein